MKKLLTTILIATICTLSGASQSVLRKTLPIAIKGGIAIDRAIRTQPGSYKGPRINPIAGGGYHIPSHTDDFLKRQQEQMKRWEERRDSLTKSMQAASKAQKQTLEREKIRREIKSTKNRCQATLPKVVNGDFDQQPLELLKIADMAYSVDDKNLMIACVQHASSDYLSVSDISSFAALDHKQLQDPYLPKTIGMDERYVNLAISELVNYVAMRNYANRFVGDSITILPQDSAAIADRDELVSLAERYAPKLIPMAKLGYVEDLSVYTPELNDVARDILNDSISFGEDFDASILQLLAYRLFEKGDYTALAALYDNPVFKAYADRQWGALAMLAVAYCAIDMDDKSIECHEKAIALDQESTEEYFLSLWYIELDDLKQHPADTERQRDLLFSITPPDEFAYALIDAYIDKIAEKDTNDDDLWEQVYHIDSTDPTKCYFDGIASVADIALSNPDLTADAQPYMKGMRAHAISATSDNPDTAIAELDRWLNEYADASSETIDNIRIILTFSKAKIVESGTAYPKKALKIMKKAQKLAEGENINDETKSMYYSYLSALYRRTGKTKQADHFQSLSQQLAAPQP